MTPIPDRIDSAPRKLRFREDDLEADYPSESERVNPMGVSEINQHLEALHLGTPGERRPNTLMKQVPSPPKSESRSRRTEASLEELMRKDHEMKLLKKAKLKKFYHKRKSQRVSSLRRADENFG